MPFKLGAGSDASDASPESLAHDLRARRVPGLLTHQSDVLRDYTTNAADHNLTPDVALQLPTGSGKTYVGLLIAEWRRRRFGERAVYLCLTNQLVKQVTEQANTLYGMRVIGFTGKQTEYAPPDRSAYLSGEAVAVTSYSALFNSYPFFKDPHLIVLDDAHAAEQYIAGHWSLRVSRTDHEPVFSALTRFLGGVLPKTDIKKLTDPEGWWDYGWVEKISTPILAPHVLELVELLDEHTASSQLSYPWRLLRDHIAACHLYVSAREFLLRPLLPPTITHAPFSGARQRIYMSATLGAGGELERVSGRKEIHRLAVPQGWDSQGIGRRLILFPESSLNEADTTSLRQALAQKAGRLLVLTPDDVSAQEVRAWATDLLQVPVYGPRELEGAKASFAGEAAAVAVVANRYDGIDFKEDECRMLFVDGLPRALNLQERFLVTRIGAGVLLDDRILTRVLQAFGRCTRTPTDYAAIIVHGDELHAYLLSPNRRGFMHPELQAELAFGIAQSSGATKEAFLDYVSSFLAQDSQWQAADRDIISRRSMCQQTALPGAGDLMAATTFEVDYVEALWEHDYVGALEHARKVLTALVGPDVKPYRALWSYLAGSAAWLAHGQGREALKAVASQYFREAARASYGIRWLHQLGGSTDLTLSEQAERLELSHLLALIERLEVRLEDLGMRHDRQFDREEVEILGSLDQADAAGFERGHELLGRMLGYEAGNHNSSAAPDPWWIVDSTLCFVFEDHSEGLPTSVLGANKIRQAASHPSWVRGELSLDAEATIVPILVTAVTRIEHGAAPHLDGLFVWPKAALQDFAQRSLAVIRQLRRTFPGAGDIGWRAEAMERYRAEGLDAPGLRNQIQPASAVLSVSPSSP